MVLGGGTSQNLWSDHLLQIVMLPLTVIGIVNIFECRLGTLSKALVILIFLVLTIQFLPVFGAGKFPTMPEFSSRWEIWTITPSRSLEAALFTIAVLGFSLFVTQLSDYQQQRLMRFVALGFVINLLIGIIQLSFGSQVKITGVLPYDISSGMFGNENHFSSLVYIMIPLFAWRFLADSRRPWIFLLIAGSIVFFEFAVGSRAGMAISAMLTVFSFIWVSIGSTSLWLKITSLSIIIVGIGVMIIFVDRVLILDGDYRATMFLTTWNAVQDHWLTGTGLGSFLLVYPMYEIQEVVKRVYANQAHNDFLQLLLELGIVFVPMAILYLVQIGRNMFRSSFTRLASISIFAVLAHSFVDYPLRTMSIAIVFGTLSAIVLSEREFQIEQ